MGGLTLLGTTTSPAAVYALAPITLITWGAWRTATYRPQAVKDQIHTSLAQKASVPHPGTVGELTGW